METDGDPTTLAVSLSPFSSILPQIFFDTLLLDGIFNTLSPAFSRLLLRFDGIYSKYSFEQFYVINPYSMTEPYQVLVHFFFNIFLNVGHKSPSIPCFWMASLIPCLQFFRGLSLFLRFDGMYSKYSFEQFYVIYSHNMTKPYQFLFHFFCNILLSNPSQQLRVEF